MNGKSMRCSLFLLAIFISAPLMAKGEKPAAPPAFTERMATRETLQQLRQGGYVLYVRHGDTDNSRADRFPHVDLNDCSTQRVLSGKGRQLMRDIGKQIRSARIPVSDVRASPMCRTRESATLMFGQNFTVSSPLMYSANMTSEEKIPRLTALEKILREPLPAGSNRLLIAHAPNLADLIGFFVKPEGTVVIFAQRGEAGYEYVASIRPEMWTELLR